MTKDTFRYIRRINEGMKNRTLGIRVEHCPVNSCKRYRVHTVASDTGKWPELVGFAYGERGLEAYLAGIVDWQEVA